jgi:hypothetical protein
VTEDRGPDEATAEAGAPDDRHPGLDAQEHPADEYQHHELADTLLGIDDGSGEPGDATIDQLMQESIGGWRGLFDTSLPSLAFLVAYWASGKHVSTAVWAAVIGGGLVALLRLARRQSVRQVLSGFPVLLLSAWLASRSGRAEDFFLPGIVINVVVGVGLAVSALVGHPAAGYFVGALTADLTGWRRVPEQRRAAALATWFFAAYNLLRVVVRVPLYLAGNVNALGIVGLAMGWPLMILAAYFSYLVITRARRDAPVPPLDDSAEPADAPAG